MTQHRVVSHEPKLPRVGCLLPSSGLDMTPRPVIRTIQPHQRVPEKKKLGCGLMVFCLLLFSSSRSFGANKTFLPHSKAAKSGFHAPPLHSVANLKNLLGLSAKEDLRLIRKTKGRADRTHFRYQQFFDGLPVRG